MKLGKAIEILTNFYKSYLHSLRPDEINAIKLGVEAMKEIQQVRLHSVGLTVDTLPGETKE